ncbi:TetR/AcrR family transcriptional regulator [Albidovulum sp.]
MSQAPKYRRRAEARPDEILDAALALFTRKGFAQTRVEEIARAAGLSKGAVYLYFPSKEALLEGLVRRAVAPVARRVVAELEAGAAEPRAALARVLGAIATALGDPGTVAVPMLVIREAPGVPSIARIYREEVLSRVIPALAGLLDRARREGAIRDIDPELGLRSVIGAMIAHLLLARVFGIVPAGGLQLERLVETHLDILFKGLEPRKDMP